MTDMRLDGGREAHSAGRHAEVVFENDLGWTDMGMVGQRRQMTMSLAWVTLLMFCVVPTRC